MAKKTNSIIRVPEIKVSFDKHRAVDFPKKITSSDTAAELLRSLFDKGEIELHEVMFVIYLNQSNQPIGYYKHSIGGIAATVVDTRIILGAALKSLSTGIIICHNHPSGGLKPSEADKQMTKQMKQAASSMNIQVLDHVIVTKNGHASFADQGLMGIESEYPIDLSSQFINDEKLTKNQELEALALEIELDLLKI